MDTLPSPAPEQLLRSAPPELAGFDTVRRLGGGAQGQVWLLNPRDGSEPVAAKFLTAVIDPLSPTESASSARHNESQITHEWRVLAQFSHDHLVSVHRMVRDDQGVPVLLMDFAAGGSLAQIIQARGPLTVGEAVTVLTPMGQVLAFLHSRGAVHGDLAPGNVLLTAAGKPLLADFGFGRLLGQAVEQMAGTPGFYCPSDCGRDAAADVFALAAVGWYALTGMPAPRTADRMPLATVVSDVPTELVAALEAGLQEDSSRRPTAAAFAQAVFRSARAEAVALGNAVHPSILPDLPTRRDLKPAKPRRPRWGSRAWRSRRQARKEARPSSTARGHSGRRARLVPRERSPRRIRRSMQQRRLKRVWANHSSVGRTGVWSQWRGWNRRFAVVAGLAFVAVMAVLVAGSWQIMVAGTTAPRKTVAPKVAVASMAWAAALPSDIRAGLASQEPIRALQALAWTRSYALSNTDAALLANINSPDSTAAVADNLILQSLRDRGHTLTGLETTVTNAKLVQGSNSDAVTVVATVTTSAFAEVDTAGSLKYKHTAEQKTQLAIVLVASDGRWIVRNVQKPEVQKPNG